MSWKKLTDQLRTDDALAHIDAAGVEAVVDVLTLTLYADHDVGFMEKMELDHLLHE